MVNSGVVVSGTLIGGGIGLVIGLALVKAASPKPVSTLTPESVHYHTPRVSAYEFRLEDGTRCVVVRGGGVDCEWK